MAGPFIGRGRELAFLLGRLDEAALSCAGIVVCVGQAGMGKTRLLHEVGDRASRRGFRVLRAAAAVSGSPPLWHWRTIAVCLRDAGVAGAEEVTAVLAGLSGTPSSEDRGRQFDAVTALVCRAAAERPIVLLLDDLDDADEASWLVLRHLARSFHDAGVLVVASARICSWGCEPRSGVLELTPWTRTDVTAVFTDAVGRAPSSEELDSLITAGGGNPFFVTELLRQADARGLGVPVSVREAIAHRMSRLPPAVAACVEAGAVLGLEFPHVLAAAMTGTPAPDCLSACSEAAAATLLDDRGGGFFAFDHTVVRDAVLERLPAPHRAELHRRAALALEGWGARTTDRIFEIADHWNNAAPGDRDRARAGRWIAEAGRASMRRHAYEDARQRFTTALAVSYLNLSEEQRCQLLLARASAEALSGDLPAALGTCREVVDTAVGLGLADVAAAAAVVPEPTFDPAYAMPMRVLCESVLPLEPMSLAARVSVLAQYALLCDYLGDLDEAGAAGDEALRLARSVEDAAATVEALNANRLVRSGPDSLAARIDAAAELRSVGDRMRDAKVRLSAAEWHFDIAAERGDLAGAARELQVIGRYAGEVGGPIPQWRFQCHQAMLAQARGRFADARRYGREALEAVAPLGYPHAPMLWAGLITNLCHQTGYDADALAVLDLADEEGAVRDRPLAGVVLTLSPAWVLTQIGRLGEARALYRRLGPPAGWIETPHARLFAWALGIATASALGEDEDVAALRGTLARYRGHHIVNGRSAMAYLGPAELWLGVGAAHLGLLQDAIEEFEQAVKACAANGAAGFRAQAEVELAAVLARRRAAGDLDRARALAASGARTARELGMPPVETRARGVIERVDTDPSRRLTPREVEVAHLVAERLTNREIASRLVLSERTAQNHVQHILGKLGLRNREQITAWVRQEMSTPAE